jgi:hypothetical protein
MEHQENKNKKEHSVIKIFMDETWKIFVNQSGKLWKGIEVLWRNKVGFIGENTAAKL